LGQICLFSLDSSRQGGSGDETIYNGAMRYRSLFRLSVLAALLGLVLSSLAAGAQQTTPKRGRKYKAPPPTARIEVTVVRDLNGKPIENASVIFHPLVGNKDAGNMELKSNEDGKSVIDVLTLGDTVRMQIIAKGFQTYGDDYKIDKAEMAIEIRMKRPGEQYSTYKDHPQTLLGGKTADAAAAKPAAPAASDKPAAQHDAQPSQPQAK
jgi:hypothetical protein